MDFALTAFTPLEFSALNCGDYHDVYHALYVADVVMQLARRVGRSAERVVFLGQVALLHDADPRPVGTPANVRRTLGWMGRNQKALVARLQWDTKDFTEALALIARTDFPYQLAPQKSADRWDGLSPVELYDLLLSRVEREKLEQAMEDAQLLRFADQVASYVQDWDTALLCVDGLVREFATKGVQTDRETLDTAQFLRCITHDLYHDRRVAWSQGVSPRFFSLSDLHALMPAGMLATLRLVSALFRAEHAA